MHYIVGQEVLGGNYSIHLIQQDVSAESYKIWIETQSLVQQRFYFGKNLKLLFRYL